jgi:hypothetical protein
MRSFLTVIASCCLLTTATSSFLYSASGAPQGVQSKIPTADKAKEAQQNQEARTKRQENERNVQQRLEQRIKQIRETAKGQGQPHAEGVLQEGKEYSYPGLVIFNGQEWQGSDNVYNISKFIAVGADISVDASENEAQNFPIKAAETRERIKAIFQNAGITPYANNNTNFLNYPASANSNMSTVNAYTALKPPLPLFMVVIIAQPINRGYAVYCAANLFEEVDVKRAQYNEGTLQAITWERQHLIVGASEEIGLLVNKCIDDLAYGFVKVRRYFEYARPAR